MESSNITSSQIATSSKVTLPSMLVSPHTLPVEQDDWEDVTDAFAQARQHMAVGEMIHSYRFSLFSAMSAIELMDPKMDVGFGDVRDLRDIQLPTSLSDAQVINIMDRLFACEMSWLDSHTLPQTVFSCVYTQRLADVPRTELFSFLRLQIATMDCASSVISDEKVAEEEDFVSWNYGFSLTPLESVYSATEEEALAKFLSDAESRPQPDSEHAKSLSDAIMLRLHFRVMFYKTLCCLSGAYIHLSPFQAAELINGTMNLVHQWMDCPHRSPVDTDLMDLVFDPSINRHLMTSTPPRTAPLFDIGAALSYILRILTELRALLALRQLALPPDAPKRTGLPPVARFSLHVSIQALEMYCAQYNPRVLTRSFMSRLMTMGASRPANLFDNERSDYARLVATDMGLTDTHCDEGALLPLEGMRDGVAGIFECFCGNRSRQRRQLLRVLRCWDHGAFVSARKEQREAMKARNDNASGSEERSNKLEDEGNRRAGEASGGDEGAPAQKQLNALEGKMPMELVAYEVCCRLMVHHWLLGFECELYHEFEYAAVFFYMGYVLSCMGSATTMLSQAGLKDASLHKLRYGLYLMDEARHWLCRAFYMTLEALSSHGQWSYSSRRNAMSRAGRQMFGSEEMWYEQRFGVFVGLLNGPAYANHGSIASFNKMQEQILQEQCPEESDIIALRLSEASSAFLVARQRLERTKKEIKDCEPNVLLGEVLQLGRVAVENSITLAKAIKQNEKRLDDAKTQSPRYKVTFSFNRHRHFPIIKINDIDE